MTLADERRLVTVLFADLVGFTGRAESSDPETVRDLQRRYFEVVSRQVERYGGTVEKYIGDAVMAIFGAPIAHDDDAERALRAAVRIREAVGGLEDELRVRIGVNTGEVVGGLGSGPHAADYTVSGDAVNVAARLQQTAGPNEIYVGGTTRMLSADAFVFAALPELALKGREESMESWRLETELPERPRLRRGGEAPLVGRARELAALDSALDEAAEGRGLMVAVVGEAGIGKSRLSLETRQRAEANGFASIWTTSRSYATAFPYHLMGQLTEQLIRPAPNARLADALVRAGVSVDEAILERWAEVLEDVLRESDQDGEKQTAITPSGRQRILVQALTSLLRAQCGRQPLLVVLDDLHWADAASLAALEELLDIVPELRIALLAVYRSGWSHGWEGKSSYEQLNLRALRPQEARALAAQLAPDRPLSSELTQRVLERSAGNPFFLEELLRCEGEAGDPTRRLPETVHETLLARLDALPPVARQTLQIAAVVGIEFGQSILAGVATDVTDAAGVDDALRTLQRAELIVDRGGEGVERVLAFRHPLIHEVAYRSLLVSTRRSLHGRIARWLEEHGGDELTSALALHYRDGDDPAKACHYLPLAGKRAESLNASREAHGWYMDAAAAFEDDPKRRAEMLAAAARQIYLIGGVDKAVELLREAIELYEGAGDELAALGARRWLGRYLWYQGNPEVADAEIGRAIAGLERHPPSPDLAFAYSFRAQSLMLRPDFEAGAEWARKAIAVAEATGATDALVHAYNNLGTSLAGMGDPEGQTFLRRSLDLATANNLTDDAGRAYANLSGQGNRIFPFPYQEANDFLTEGLEFAERTIPGGVFDQWIRSGWAEFLISTARWSEADRVLGDLRGPLAGVYMEGEIATLRSHIAAYRGRYDEAAALVGEAAENAVRIGDQQAFLPTLAAAAHGQAGLGNESEAVAALGRAIDLRGSTPEGSLSSWFLFEAADVLTGLAVSGGAPVTGSSVASGIRSLAEFASRIAGDASAAGDAVLVTVRRALYGAAAEQIAVLCGRVGVPTPEPGAAEFPGREAGAIALDGEHRFFDAARARLWLAEEHRDPALLGDAGRRFADLGAHPYAARAAALGR